MISSVSVSTTATTVLAAPTGYPYKFAAISNVGSTTVYLKVVSGGDAVSATNGIPLAAGASFVIDQDAQRELLDAGATACTESGTSTVSVQAF